MLVTFHERKKKEPNQSHFTEVGVNIVRALTQNFAGSKNNEKKIEY